MSTIDDSKPTRDKTSTERKQATSGPFRDGWPKYDNFALARTDAYRRSSGSERDKTEPRQPTRRAR